MLNATNISLVAFSHYLQDLRGQIFAIFIITVAAAEAAIGLAILVVLVRNKGAVHTTEITEMKG
jgi:NADH-quinone oxidoreductase subunit K